jgi:Domain of unknown function (DUF4263)
MMALLEVVAVKKQQAKSELKAFKALLDGKGQGVLGEAGDFLPFFDEHKHLCALMGMYNPKIVEYQSINIAREFSIFGDHRADLVIGDNKNSQFCFIEFEDAKSSSIFSRAAGKSTPEWSHRYNHGFSQLIDWILWIENNKGNTAFKTKFQANSIQFNMLLVIGRDRHLKDPALRERFDWRSDSVVVASKKVHCITYDKLYDDLFTRLRIFGG